MNGTVAALIYIVSVAVCIGVLVQTGVEMRNHLKGGPYPDIDPMFLPAVAAFTIFPVMNTLVAIACVLWLTRK